MNWKKLWVKERNEAVRNLDVDSFRKFYEKWMRRGFYDIPLPVDDKVVEIMLRKMMYNIKTFSDEEKENAKKWLEERGLSTSLGGTNGQVL